MLQKLTYSPFLTEALGVNFLVDPPGEDIPKLIFTPSSSRPNHYPIRILVIGIPQGVDSIVNELYIRRFAQVYEWSRPIPSRYPGEIMRVMTRDFVMTS